MPRDVQDKYTAAGWDSMATCEDGAVYEHRRFGASYADVISERIARVHDFSFAKESEDVRRTAAQVRAESLRLLAKVDQTAAESRELREGVDSRRALPEIKPADGTSDL